MARGGVVAAVEPAASPWTIVASTPAQHLVHRQPVADQPGRADRDLDGAGLGAPVDSAAATASAVAWVSWKPCGPVQALAPPELRITARSRRRRPRLRDHSTGAALTWLRVNTPRRRSRDRR